MTVTQLGVRFRRTWPQRLLIAFNLALIMMLLTGAGGLGYFYWRFGQIPRLNLAVDEAKGPAFNVLLVGSDSRSEIDDSEAGKFGGASDVGGQRADTLMVLRVDPTAAKASLLSIPRDLWVPIAGRSSKSRINSAFTDGPDQLIATVRNALGIDINHFVAVDFNGFREIVKEIGGVKVFFPGPARDQFSGLNVAEGGCIELDGDQALGYVRARHYQYYESGRWRSDPTSDIGRIARQQDFIRRVLRKVIKSSPFNIGRIQSLVEVGVRNVQIDDRMGFNEMIRLARRFKELDPAAIDMFTLPVRNGNVGGASVLFLQAEEAAEVLAHFRPQVEATPGDARPSSTTVRIFNGTGRSGEASRVAGALQTVGFTVQATGDAEKYGYPHTQVLFAPGQQSKAALLRSYVIGGAELIESPRLGSDVAIVTGADFVGISQSPTAAPASTVVETTTTTVPPDSSVPDAVGTDPAAACV